MGEFLRSESSQVGKSLVQIKKVDTSKSPIIEDVLGQRVELHPLPVGNATNCYMIIEKLIDQNIALIDFVYGDINLVEFEKNATIRNRILRELSRVSISDCTSHYMGGLNRNVAVILANIVKRVAYAEMRTVSINMKDPFSSKNKSGSIRETLFKFATRKANRQEQPTEVKTENGIELYGADGNEARRITTGEGIIFYPSGAAIIGNNVCTKFNYCTKDVETGNVAKLDSFLVSGVNLSQLEINELYRKRFVSQMCVPSRLRNLRGKLYPYLGTFTSTMQFENDYEILDIITKLREKDEGRY